MIIPVRYQVLGPLGAGRNSIVPLGGPKQRLVLAVLIIRLRAVVSDDRLVDELWPEAAPDGARHAIQTYISELRRAIDDPIERTGNGYRLNAEPAAVDAHRFETLVAAGRERTRDAPASASALFHEALALWHGDPYGGVAESPLLRAEVHRLNDLRLAVVEDRVAADLDAGRHAQVTAELEALTREYPFRERFHALHMLALYRCNRQADALRAYHHARRWLDDELGLDPSAELQELERRILNQDTSLLRTVPTAAVAVEGAPPTSDPAASVRGFELRERIGASATATTYRAYQASLGREIAVRIISSSAAGPDAWRGFDAHARRVAETDHPNILPLLDWWREAGSMFMVTPWIRGGSLEAAMGRGPWSLSAALRLAEQVGGALAAAHRRGIIHGNLTPGNVLLDADANALVADFALAPSEGPRGDVRSLAVLLVGLLTGREADAANPVLALGSRGADIPADLVAVLAQAGSAVPADRHSRMEDFLRDLRQAAGIDVVAPASVTDAPDCVRNPYKGLQAFHEADAPDFFGRDALVGRVVEAVQAHKLVVVAGASGSGKSSLVRAGLLPTLRAGRVGAVLHVAEMFPGTFPMEELERALRTVGTKQPNDLYASLAADDSGLVSQAAALLPAAGELLLIVDQLEELWSLTQDISSRRHFLASLVAAASDPQSRVRVLATLRADFLDRALETHDLGELTRRGLVLITPPSATELAEAVTRPAQQVGLHFEGALAERILRDVQDEPGALPLLQHALAELVGVRAGHQLTVEGYERIGGVTGAIGLRAETVFGELSRGGQELARQVFLRLVAVDEAQDDARRRVRRTELGSLTSDAPLVDEVLRVFGAHRLLTFDRDPVTRGPTVEVAHEALFNEWARLRGWIDERRGELMLQRRLRLATQDWVDADRAPDYLLAGARLAETEGWSSTTDLVLSRDERDFLVASRDREARAAAARARRRNITVLGAVAVAVVGLVLATLASMQTGRAERSEREARARALAAGSVAELENDQDLALLLALDAVQTSLAAGEEPLVEAVSALHAATIAHRTTTTTHGAAFLGFVEPGTAVSLGFPLPAPILWDTTTGRVIGDELETPDSAPGDPVVSPSGHLAASAYRDEPLWVWDLTTGTVAARVGEGEMIRPAISPDDRLAAVISPRPDGQRARVYALDGGALLGDFEVEGWHRLAFGPAGSWLAVTDELTPVVRLHEPRTGELIATLGQPDEGGYLWDLAADSARNLLALYVESPNRIDIYDVAERALLRSIPTAARPGRICFISDHYRVAAEGADQLVHVWNIDTGVEVITVPGPTIIEGLACSPHRPLIAVADMDGTTRIYDLAPTATTELAAAVVVDPSGGVVTPDGDALVATYTGAFLRIDPAGTVTAQADASVAANAGWIALSPDGRTVAAPLAPDPASGAETPVGLFDATSLDQVGTVGVPGDIPLAYSPDGKTILLGGYGGAALIDVASGRRVALDPPEGAPDFPISSGAFLPSGGHAIVTAPGSRETWIYAVDDGSFVGSVCSTLDNLRVAVDPAGERLIVVDHESLIEVFGLAGLLEAIADSDGLCPADGPHPSDGNRLLSFGAPAEGGIAFSPDGRWLASSSGYEGTLTVSELASGRRLFEIEHDGEVTVVGFSPDGRTLAITYGDNRGNQDAVRLYAVATEDLVAVARSKVTRQLTAEQCTAYPEAISCPQP